MHFKKLKFTLKIANYYEYNVIYRENVIPSNVNVLAIHYCCNVGSFGYQNKFLEQVSKIAGHTYGNSGISIEESQHPINLTSMSQL